MGDVNFEEDAFHREFTDEVVIADNVKDLLDMQGAGKVRNLREAASLFSARWADGLSPYWKCYLNDRKESYENGQ